MHDPKSLEFILKAPEAERSLAFSILGQILYGRLNGNRSVDRYSTRDNRCSEDHEHGIHIQLVRPATDLQTQGLNAVGIVQGSCVKLA